MACTLRWRLLGAVLSVAIVQCRLELDVLLDGPCQAEIMLSCAHVQGHHRAQPIRAKSEGVVLGAASAEAATKHIKEQLDKKTAQKIVELNNTSASSPEATAQQSAHLVEPAVQGQAAVTLSQQNKASSTRNSVIALQPTETGDEADEGDHLGAVKEAAAEDEEANQLEMEEVEAVLENIRTALPITTNSAADATVNTTPISNSHAALDKLSSNLLTSTTNISSRADATDSTTPIRRIETATNRTTSPTSTNTSTATTSTATASGTTLNLEDLPTVAQSSIAQGSAVANLAHEQLLRKAAGRGQGGRDENTQGTKQTAETEAVTNKTAEAVTKETAATEAVTKETAATEAVTKETAATEAVTKETAATEAVTKETAEAVTKATAKTEAVTKEKVVDALDDQADIEGDLDDAGFTDRLQADGDDKVNDALETVTAVNQRRLLGSHLEPGLLLGQQQFHKHEAAHLMQQQEQVTEVLTKFDLNPGMPVAALLSASAPIARCLRQAMRSSLVSISPDTPQISTTCQEDVRGFFITRSGDAKFDLPLIAACATDILKHCKLQSGSTQVPTCLKHAKAKLQPLCQTAVIQRQIDSSEDVMLDPELSKACAMDRERLCSDVGWGEGVAQACLESHANAPSTDTVQGKKAAATANLGLSPACNTALFRRQVEESEDVRFNFRLSRACAGEKNMFCHDVRPGTGDVVGCLEHHAFLPDFTEACRAILDYNAQLRSTDVRLDAQFKVKCAADVRALCFEEEAKVLHSLEEPPGAGAPVLECMRRSMGRIRAAACSRHVTGLMVAAYHDSRLDPLLLDRCADDMARLCMDPREALSCLKGRVAKHVSLEPECSELVRERSRQAAADLAFLPHLEAGCADERHRFCSAAHLTGPHVLDCLADSRHRSEFGSTCRTALVAHLADAVSDVRMLHTLNEDCTKDIATLCNGTEHGEGRVLACLQQQRADIADDKCKMQMLRMMGLIVEDHRLDYVLAKACLADVQQFCAGLQNGSGGPGAVHECLRKSSDHLSPECQEAEAELEAMEHADVRLNPRIQKECPLAISMFCGEIAAGNANVMTCLQQSSSKAHFPENCRIIMASLLERSSQKYSLNIKLKAACDTDVAKLCPDANDEPESAVDPGVLGCLTANSSTLSKPCRTELSALVRVHLNRYRIGLPLTSPCDGDVLARCNVDKQVTPFIMGGYIQSCLSKSFDKLHKPCWALLSMFDEGQFKAVTVLESKPWTAELQKEAIDKVASQVTVQLRRELEPKIIANMHSNIKTAVELQHGLIRPLLFGLTNAVSLLLVLVVVLALLAWYVWRKYITPNSRLNVQGRTVAIKDGRV